VRAVVLIGHGGPDQLALREDFADPAPGPGEVRVAVSAAGVNNTDIWTREGAYGRPDDPHAVAGWRGVPLDFPRIQGGDIVGTVDTVGSEVDPDLRGRRVLVDPALYGYDGPDAIPIGILGSEQDGGFAEYVIVAGERVHDVTASPLSDQELAALPIAYGTAMGMLDRAGLESDETVVITGASGGVGTALVQLATALGSEVIAVSTSDKAEVLGSMGARFVVDRHASDFPDRIRAAAPDGVDVVADVVGGELFSLWPGLLALHGRIVVAGAIAGPLVRVDLRQLYLGQRRIIGSTMHTPAQFVRLVQMAVSGKIAPVIAEVFPLAQIHQAQRALRHPSTIGKVILQVAD
jgi:NADPH:quinone reductase-like Zn-dependent oxidoreductase